MFLFLTFYFTVFQQVGEKQKKIVKNCVAFAKIDAYMYLSKYIGGSITCLVLLSFLTVYGLHRILEPVFVYSPALVRGFRGHPGEAQPRRR